MRRMDHDKFIALLIIFLAMVLLFLGFISAYRKNASHTKGYKYEMSGHSGIACAGEATL